MVIFRAEESTDNAHNVAFESEGPLRLNLWPDSAEVVCMHSWVFRHRERLLALYGPPRLRRCEQESAEAPTEVRERWPAVERRSGGEVILHPAVKPSARSNQPIPYRRGA